MHNLDKENERLNNSKGTQTIKKTTTEVSTQTLFVNNQIQSTPLFVNKQTQTAPLIVDSQKQIDDVIDDVCEDNFQSETEDENYDMESSFYASQTELESSSETELELSSSDESENKKPSGSAFIVFWSSLHILLQRCLTCALPATIK